ncbi:hypothetical protein EV360DRAFT_71995 [Lentinula raphanica]|nr:hypothetical protein EV360DRAFT_71995 [Lentinula raphanica]
MPLKTPALTCVDLLLRDTRKEKFVREAKDREEEAGERVTSWDQKFFDQESLITSCRRYIFAGICCQSRLHPDVELALTAKRSGSNNTDLNDPPASTTLQTHNGDKSEIYEYRHTIAFFNGIVPTSNRENPDTFVRRIRRRTLRLPSSCTSEPENYKLYTNCPLPDKGGVFKIPSSWVSAEWHTWSPEDPWLKKAFKEDKSRNH